MTLEDGLVVNGTAVAVAALGLWLAGPLGMLLVGFAMVGVGALLSRDSEDGALESSNCPDCGAVVEGDACDYCGRSLSE
ncbi:MULTISPECIES: hypothetical protein [Halorussus]|uniref:hypothetical protein n=1 Tax=Halorussus TaxID=1070314 RepID=UPI0020A19D17|nr:hypothetical protein [Halorussus vallis]USZ74222.1 hypothetical protein NGM07_12285 [Halorussus vallis]